MKTKLLLLVCICALINSNYAQKVITGRWEGKLEDSTSLRAVFHFDKKSDGSYSGTLDSPDQGGYGVPCDEIKVHGDSVDVYMAVINGHYNGVLISDSVIKGVWTQDEEKSLLTIKKGKDEQLNADSNSVETQVVLETKTGKIFGTLCTPKKFDKIPVALIIAGSGPTDRDGNNNMGLKTDAYKILAHILSQSNIATLRYDKRGIAESKAAMTNEADVRFDDFINDAKQWVELLKKDNRFSGVIIIGHSEGSLIGMDAAIKDVDKYISLAGVGETADKVLKRQLQGKMPKMGIDTCNKIIDSLVKGKTVGHIDPILFSLFRPGIQPYLISWFKHNPQADIKKLTIPVLIIQGTSDLQVDTTDAKELYAAYPKAQLDIIKGMNHVLKDVGNDKSLNIKSYSDPTMPLDEKVTKDIVEFINGK